MRCKACGFELVKCNTCHSLACACDMRGGTGLRQHYDDKGRPYKFVFRIVQATSGFEGRVRMSTQKLMQHKGREVKAG